MSRKIRIYGEKESSSIFFVGSTVAPKPLGTIVATKILKGTQDRIKIVRNDRFKKDGITPRVLFKWVRPQIIADESGNFLMSGLGYNVDQVVEYINLESISADTVLDFKVDSTNTTILVSNGDDHAVNSIKAIGTANGLITIEDLAGNDIYTDLQLSDVSLAGNIPASTQTGMVNCLNALFSVTPIGIASLDHVPTYPLYDGSLVASTKRSGEVPSTAGIYGPTSTTDAYIISPATDVANDLSEHFTVKMAGDGSFMIGLFDTSNTTDVTEAESGTTDFADAGMQWGVKFNDYGSYVMPSQAFGTDSGVVQGIGWTGETHEQIRYNVDLQEDLTPNRAGVEFKIGIMPTGFIGLYYLDTYRSNEYVFVARSDYQAVGNDYRLIVKMESGSSVELLEEPVKYLRDSTGVTLNYRYIESPDGYYSFPLFATQGEAQYFSSDDAAVANIFVDEPTNTTWYAPNVGYTSSTQDSSLYTPIENNGGYQEILTSADSFFTPTAFVGNDFSFAENVSGVNINITTDSSYTTTLTGLPSGLTYSAGYIQGTTGYVGATTVYTVTVRRTNTFGYSEGTFDITVTDNPALSAISGWTVYHGSTLAPNQILHDEYAVLKYDTLLKRGEQFRWTQVNVSGSSGGAGQYAGMGILSGLGETAALAGDKLHPDVPVTVSTHWDLKAIFWTDKINQSAQGPTGWTDNSILGGNNGNVEFIWAYGDDGYMRLYRAGTLIRTSSATFSGDQELFLYARENYTIQTFVPSIVAEDTVYTGSPVTGFTLASGDLDASDVLGEDSAATLDAVLQEGKRYILNQSWVESYVLPYLRDNQQKAYFGVPVPNVNWTNIGMTDDFHAVMRWQRTSTTQHQSGVYVKLPGENAGYTTINSMTDSYFDYALEWDGTNLYVIRCNVNSLSTEPGVSFGGSFSTVKTFTNYDTFRTGDLPLALATKDDASIGLSTAGMTIIDIPLGANDIVVTEDANGVARFDGGLASTVTLQAGYTYKFMMNNATVTSTDTLTFELTDGTSYTTGVTNVGSHGDYLYYVEFAVPSDVPPLNIIWNGVSQGVPVISGSTHTATITGITLEGPSANQTGTNVMDAGDHGWISLNERLSPGERLVFDNAFLEDLFDAMVDAGAPQGSSANIRAVIGLKGSSFSNTVSTDYPSFPSGQFIGDHYLEITAVGSNVGGMKLWSNGYGGNAINLNSGSLLTECCAFMEVTNTGGNIRSAFGRNGNLNVVQGDEATVEYLDWYGYKRQTGEQDFGITNGEVVIGFWTYGAGDLDGAEIDWTGLSEVSIPTPAVSNLTPWNKAVDFSGGSENLNQISTNTSYNPLRMNNISSTVSVPTTSGNTSADANANPWTTAIVFNPDGNNSNQHIWNSGEGASSTDDNIYLRLAGNGELYFGWGRGSSNNECKIATGVSSTYWYGVYVASNGTRLSGSDATASNLADAFDIYVMTSQDSFGSIGSQKSISSNWTSTGQRMDRAITGNFTIGGRGGNRNFHGKVASMVITNLRIDQPMPNTNQIKTMITDPKKWEDDYRLNQTVRSTTGTEREYGSVNVTHGFGITHIWLMGDGTNDSFGYIFNQVYHTDTNHTYLNFNSMVSNDIETVSINGLT